MGDFIIAEHTTSEYRLAGGEWGGILKLGSFVADGGAVLRPADGALPRGLLVALGAFRAEAHVAAGREDYVSRAGEADRALLAVVAAEEVVRAVDVLQAEGQAAPLQIHRF